MIETLDLSVARNRVGIGATYANPVNGVTVMQLPAGVAITLHLGHGHVGYPILQEGQTFEPDPPHTDGVFITNAAGVGVLILDVSFLTYTAPTPVVDVSRAPKQGSTPARFLDQLLRNFGVK